MSNITTPVILPQQFYNIQPLVFDDSLSYLEQQAKLNAKMIELVEYVNSLEDLGNEYTDEQITIIRSYVNSLNTDIINRLSNQKTEVMQYTDTQLQAEVQTINDSIVSNVATLNTKIDTLNDTLSEVDVNLNNLIELRFTESKAYSDVGDAVLLSKINSNYNFLLNLIQQYDIAIIDPTTGELTTFQKAINNVYAGLRFNGITAEVFDLLDLTVTEFENYQITAEDFDFSAKTILV